ncbi:hypothetical protein DFQ27_005987 [Actinomortierella ambigua]|uniref:Ricin B lectin domain-containing protein n=1 Tax=Actinomortierella ambigua TaxID=1343610 RepID=A0A9P6PZE7_9FUNG|nr:hypothetical protein DFQ27_005987 [Actinomortierella ambigua]
MVRTAIFAAVVALVVLSTATALTFDYDVRILNRKEGGWLNGHNIPQHAPIAVEEKSASTLGVWSIVDADEGEHIFYNSGSRLPVVPPRRGMPLETAAVFSPPARVRLEDVDVSAYRIKETSTELYWTRINSLVFLRPLDPSDDNQIWEFRPQGFDDEFAFWE